MKAESGQVAVRPVYEDFRPAFERQRLYQTERLLLYLPGFPKENIRVSTEGKNMVRIRGEHLVAGNKWNRFQEDFLAPDDCNMTEISARFENGILTLTMPSKKLVSTTPNETDQSKQKPPLQHDSPLEVVSPMISKSQEKDDNNKDRTKPKKQGTNQGIYMQAVKSLTQPFGKRQLLINASAAVLVIVALGAYISLHHRDFQG